MAFKKSIRKTTDGYLEKLNERYGNAVESRNLNNNSVRLISDKIRNQKFELEKA